MPKCSTKNCPASRLDEFYVRQNGKPYGRCTRHYSVGEAAKSNAKRNAKTIAKSTAENHAKRLDALLTKEQLAERSLFFQRALNKP